MKILDFFKSLVLPSKMERYKNISALIALIIFVLSTYLMAMPYGQHLAKGALNLKTEYNFKVLQEIDLTTDGEENTNAKIIKEIIDYGCSVNDKGELECSAISDGDQTKDKKIEYQKDGITKRIHIFFDFYSKDGTPRYDITRGFPIKEPEENEENPNPNPVFPYVENVEDYFIIITKTNVLYQAFPMVIDESNIKHNDVELKMAGLILDYANNLKEFNLKDQTPETFGPYILDTLLTGFSEYARSTSFFRTFMLTFGFPFIMVLLFWLFFRKNGRLNRFKEYYNIAAIASIIPLIISFAIAWYVPEVITWYVFIFAIYYLFVLFRINNSIKEDNTPQVQTY